MTTNREILGLAAAAFAGVQVGAAIVASRYVLDGIGPATLALSRYAIALLCLLPAVAAANRIRFIRRDLMIVMSLGIAQFGLLIALLNLGVKFLDANRAAMLFSTFPLMTIAIAALLGRERPTRPKVLGVLLSIAGVGGALGVNVSQGIAEQEWLGVIAVLAAALCGSLCSVFYRPYLDRYPTVTVGAVSMAAAVGFLLLLAGLEIASIGLPRLGPAEWLIVLLIGLSSGIGYVAWLWALKTVSATRVTLFLALSPLTATLFAIWFLGEPLTLGTSVGLAGILAGLWIASRNRDPAELRGQVS